MTLYLKTGLLMFALLSCNLAPKNAFISSQDVDNPFTFTYHLDNPDTVWQMPAELVEISGLSCFGDSGIAAVQDEDARIYLLDTASGKVTSTYNFGDKGDFEGIAIIDSVAWVLESNGNLYRVENFKHPHPAVTKFKTPLTAANNAEGLAYDKETNALLIACKGKPGLKKGEKYEGFKAIYSFRLDDQKMDATPRFLIDLSVIEGFRKSGAIRDFYIRTAKKAGLISDNLFFEPSGIAFHPHNNHLFVISHTAKLLLVLNREGHIVDIRRLNPRLFNQPEGICCSNDGTLYISNEGGRGLGNIMKFETY